MNATATQSPKLSKTHTQTVTSAPVDPGDIIAAAKRRVREDPAVLAAGEVLAKLQTRKQEVNASLAAAIEGHSSTPDAAAAEMAKAKGEPVPPAVNVTELYRQLAGIDAALKQAEITAGETRTRAVLLAAEAILPAWRDRLAAVARAQLDLAKAQEAADSFRADAGDLRQAFDAVPVAVPPGRLRFLALEVIQPAITNIEKRISRTTTR